MVYFKHTREDFHSFTHSGIWIKNIIWWLVILCTIGHKHWESLVSTTLRSTIIISAILRSSLVYVSFTRIYGPKFYVIGFLSYRKIYFSQKYCTHILIKIIIFLQPFCIYLFLHYYNNIMSYLWLPKFENFRTVSLYNIEHCFGT